MKRNDMKLELKHIAPYLPYDLIAISQDGDKFSIIGSLGNSSVIVLRLHDDLVCWDLEDIKPILRPLSSITKEEAYEFGVLLMSEAEMEDKKVGMGEMALMGGVYPTIMYQDQEDDECSVLMQFGKVGISGMSLIPYEAYEWLFKNHFDVFDLIGNNLAIEK